MALSVRERADAIATFRFWSVFLMETLARWVPTTPELEVKVLFGRHLWDFAQHADAFGKRTAELRLGLHASRKPAPVFQAVLERLRDSRATTERVEGMYGGLVPSLEALYRDYLARTDTLLDEPSVRILERALMDLGRLRREREDLRKDRPEIDLPRGASPFRIEPASIDGVVEFRPDAAASAEIA
jgi:hypothetical protein